ncbi:hypothetical protein [Moorena producens]|uniref:hypothetical protein n=1 Tax=Moorena producens TaxID=1155739 RepID=UPI0011EA6B9E|nr:hypothetical protein [Moorena producens]
MKFKLWPSHKVNSLGSADQRDWPAKESVCCTAHRHELVSLALPLLPTPYSLLPTPYSLFPLLSIGLN